MDLITITYAVYILITVALTIWVAQTLSKNGMPFLIEVFSSKEKLAESVNHLLVVGFYLINLGWASLALKLGYDVCSVRESVEALSNKIGFVMLVLGVLHFTNMILFTQLHRWFANQKHGSALGN